MRNNKKKTKKVFELTSAELPTLVKIKNKNKTVAMRSGTNGIAIFIFWCHSDDLLTSSCPGTPACKRATPNGEFLVTLPVELVQTGCDTPVDITPLRTQRTVVEVASGILCDSVTAR